MRCRAGFFLVVMSTTSLAFADPPPARCSGPKLVLEPPLSHRRPWSKAAGEARRRVAELQDVDACTRIEVEQTSESVRVRASAADGRSVVRELTEPDELEATVVALLVLPPAGTDPVEATATSTTPDDAKPKPAPAASKPASPPPAAPRVNPAADGGTAAATGALAGASRQKSFEMALGGTARASSYLLGPGVTGRFDWQLGGWLVGGVLRADQTQAAATPGRYARERSAAAGFTFGRRLVRAPFYVDVLLEAPIFALRSSTYTVQTVQQSTTAPSDDGTSEPGEPSDDGTTSTTSQTVNQTKSVPLYADLRAGAAIRTVVPFKGSFAMFAELDAEHTLGILKPPSADGQPNAIGWCAGLSLGLFWGTH